MLSSTEVTMQLTVLASMKIIILLQRHSGILASLYQKEKQTTQALTVEQTHLQETFDHLVWVPNICPTTRLDNPMPTICMEVARPMAVPRVAWGTTRGMEGHMLAWSRQERCHKTDMMGKFVLNKIYFDCFGVKLTNKCLTITKLYNIKFDFK